MVTQPSSKSGDELRPEGQIKHKLAQVRFRHLKREIRNGLSRKSSNCQFNGTIDLPGRESVGVCLYKAEDPAVWNGGACDESISDRATKCHLFQCLNTKDLIRDEFDSFLEKADRARIAQRYPDMAALLWVLDLEKADVLSDIEDEEDEYVDPVPDPKGPETILEPSLSLEPTSGSLPVIRTGFLERLFRFWARIVRVVSHG